MDVVRTFKSQTSSLFIILFILVFNACDFGTAIQLKNNTDNILLIEYKTIYDEQIYRTRQYNEEIIGYVLIDGRNLQMPINSLLIKEKGQGSILFVLNNRDILKVLGYGTIESLEDTVYAINEIFIELNIYIIENEEKILLYGKEYFLDKNNLEIHGKSYVYININREVSTD